MLPDDQLVVLTQGEYTTVEALHPVPVVQLASSVMCILYVPDADIDAVWGVGP